MNQYQGAIGIFWENPKTKAKKYEFYDYFSKKIGVHSVKHISDDGFELLYFVNDKDFITLEQHREQQLNKIGI